MVQNGALTEGHARALLMADGARARRELAERAVAEGLSVRQVEAAARSGAATGRRSSAQAAEASPLTDRAVDLLYGVFEAPVRVRRRSGSAEVLVELRFADEDALRRGLDRLG